MSTLEKNIQTIQYKISKLKPGSRSFIVYQNRLIKKIEQYKRYLFTRSKEKSLLINNILKQGIEIDISKYKLTASIK